jgi:membrane dipeptidase
MFIVDSHLDLGWNALQWNRDLRESVYTIRAQEAPVAGPGRGQGTVA